MRLINANQIPKVEQTSGNGVFNIEFDSNLEKSESIDINYFHNWIDN